ncbi:MAG TPA: beta-L-arabinofuranosidase domain-containing protein, partial [Pyrinomonadaceae bacterium]|nr:beta-L-arabinofuranosidase domain-containing protein [Pyrinomonadaceae bacterium]
AEAILLKMNPEQIQQMLNTEFGGMNEVLADLYADTGDQRWLNLSHRFDHKAVVDPLSRREDRLSGLHGNTQVPKLLGVLMRYIYAGDKADGIAAEFFWDAVVNDHTYATGGHGKDEYFGPPDELSERIDGRTNESCNVYNMLKMTRQLFAVKPEMKYAEFEERALFNHVLGSIDPEDGRTCYMVPIGQGVRHEYQDMFRSFTCCVGSGMESHSLHGDGIYYESADRLWVNLYVPSTANWKAAGVQFAMDTDFPEGEKATLKLSMQRAKQFTLALRRPSWSEAGFEVRINGQLFKDVSAPGTYVALKRRWKTGDVVTVALPKSLRIEGLADNKNRAALMWGPLVLAGDMGPERRGGPADPIPSFLTESRPIEEWLKPEREKPASFRSEGIGRLTDQSKKDVEFVPFYRLHRRTYSIYWDLYNSETWTRRLAEVAAENARSKKIDSMTTVFVQPGDTQTEKGFNQQGEETSTDGTSGRRARRGKKWFSYDLPVDSTKSPALLITYFTIERSTRTFDVLVDGQLVGQQKIERSVPGSAAGHFFDVEYNIPTELLKDKKKITVRFQSTGGNEIAGVYGVRLIRVGGDK